MLLFVAVLLTLFALLVGYGYHRTGYWRRRNIPGPKSKIFVGNLNDFDTQTKPIPLQLAEWSKQYGKAYGFQRGNRNALVISDQQMAREVMHEKFDCFFARDLIPLNGNPDKKSVSHVFLARGHRWKRLRSLTSLAFTTKNLRKIFPIITSCSDKFSENLGDDLEKSSTIDFAYNLKEFTADVILRTAFGRYEDRQAIQKLINGVLDAFNQFRGLVFKFAWICPPIGGPLGALNRFIATFTNFAFGSFFFKLNRDINQRKKVRDENPDSTEEAKDFIDLLMEAQSDDVALTQATEFDKKAVQHLSISKQVDKHLSKAEILGTCILFMVAGFDTTANTLAFTVYYLALNPDVQEKLRQEIVEICGEHGEIDYDCLAKMKYNEAVMKETLRLKPIAAAVVSRRCMKATTIGGIPIEEGTDVILDTISLHTQKDVWGKDALEFRPEKWLESDVPSNQFYSFGAGPRLCIGMRLAIIEQKVALINLLRRYRIHEVPETKDLHITGIIMGPKSVKVRMERI